MILSPIQKFLYREATKYFFRKYTIICLGKKS